MSFTQTLQTGPSQVTIFGREPTVWLGVIEAALATFTAFGLGTRWGLTQETYGIWTVLLAAIFGVITAWLTKDTMLGVVLGLVKAIIAFIAIYGLTMTDQQTGAVIALTPLLLSLFQRTQTAPIVNGEVIPRDPIEIVATVPAEPEYETPEPEAA
ncbi:MAG TPA: hypothetical protein VIT65_20525 [Microlunatus sp.]